MHRFFTQKENILEKGKKIHVFEDVRHIKNVLRLSAGDEIIVCDGEGTDYLAEISEITPKCCICSVKDVKTNDAEPSYNAVLFQCIPKSAKMDFVVQKAVELGAVGVVPVVSGRVVSRPDEKSLKSKADRWRKIAEEASKQSGRGIVPFVGEAISFEDAVRRMSDMECAAMAYECERGQGLRHVLENKQICNEGCSSLNIGVLIGPEGGFEPEEAYFAQQNGIETVSLGKRILRTETAGAAVLAMIMYEFENK